MDIMSFIGLIGGIILIISGILAGGVLKTFYDIGSIYITIGGTFAVLLINFPWSTIKSAVISIRFVLFPKKFNPNKYIDIIVELATEARKSGLLALEEKAKDYDDPFIKRCILLIVDAIEPERVRSILESELLYIEERHKNIQMFFEKGAAYSPAFGMIGTLIGLINMLKDLDDPDSLGPNMAIALITTFYGSIMANMFFMPIAGKLKIRNDEERLCKEILIEGILAVQAGENPRNIQDKLYSFLPPKFRVEENAEEVKGKKDKKQKKQKTSAA